MWSLSVVNSAHVLVKTTAHQPTGTAPQMDVLSVFGFLTAVLTLLVWMHLGKSRACALAFAMCLAAMTVYAFLAGTWPLGLMEGVWCGAAIQRWRVKKIIGGDKRKPTRNAMRLSQNRWDKSRMARLFGSN